MTAVETPIQKRENQEAWVSCFHGEDKCLLGRRYEASALQCGTLLALMWALLSFQVSSLGLAPRLQFLVWFLVILGSFLVVVIVQLLHGPTTVFRLLLWDTDAGTVQTTSLLCQLAPCYSLMIRAPKESCLGKAEWRDFLFLIFIPTMLFHHSCNSFFLYGSTMQFGVCSTLADLAGSHIPQKHKHQPSSYLVSQVRSPPWNI